MLKLGKFSIGIGDRFEHQAMAQLKALEKAKDKGIDITPVWNKSNREHNIMNTTPYGTRLAADTAVKNMNWKGQYFVDADHITKSNVDKFIGCCDFFTIDVADFINKPVDKEETSKFIEKNLKYAGELNINGIPESFNISKSDLQIMSWKYLAAGMEVGKIYRHIEDVKGTGNFITEVSMDETDEPMSPFELLFVLAILGNEKVPIQTIAPKFTIPFLKGIDYQGANLAIFSEEFEEHLMVIDYAIKEFGFPDNLKLSIHSGSDKFSVYPEIKKIISKHDKGFHLKTAGTTWLEETIGLCLASEESLDLIKSIYSVALSRIEELCAPYSEVVKIDRSKLPSSIDIQKWDGIKMADTIRNDAGNPSYNPHVRQLMHVSYKVAVEYGDEFLSNLKKHSDIIGQQVTDNLYDRHICRLFDIPA
jgi:tagaturonate epimerase